MDGAARRRMIVENVTPVFAQKGFTGVTTKEIAEAAGVSEALVFRHFPTKAALYEEILKLGCLADPDLARLEALPPSTDTLVLMTYGMLWHLVLGVLGDRQLMATRQRLVLHSMMEDGEYARVHFADVKRRILPTYTASLWAAAQAGDLAPGGPAPANALWFGCHVAAQIAYGRLSGQDAYPYQGDLNTVVTEAARFILRGIGLREQVVAVPFDPQRLVLLAGRDRHDHRVDDGTEGSRAGDDDGGRPTTTSKADD
jgi:AcrR family transcriptional regulator